MTTSHLGHDHDQLRELLEICEDVFRHASPVTLHELDTTLRARGITGGPGWLIDMLGFTRLRLQHEHETTPN
jgi:hypothetical protein